MNDRVFFPLEQQIAAAFEAQDYTLVHALSLQNRDHPYSPLEEAVIGYCNPSAFQGEAQLEKALKKDREDELIAFLFAKRIWLRDPELSLPYWRRAGAIATSPSLQKTIQNYINRLVEGDENLRGSDTFLDASAFIGASDEDNPVLYPLSENPKHSSFGILTQEDLHFIRRASFGQWGIDTAVKTQYFIQNHDVNFLGIDLEAPFTFHVGRNQNLIFAPISGYSRFGNLNLQTYYGMTVKAVSNEGDFRHTVQASIYEDLLYPTFITSQSGTHFSFSYGWEWLAPTWYFRVNPFVDHVTADSDLDQTASGTFQIPYSYTSFGSSMWVEHSIGKVAFEFYTRLNLRFDQLDSVYPALHSKNIITKTRKDQSLDSKFSVSIPLTSTLQIIGWYEWFKTWSNLGASDYEDRNALDQIAGLGLKFTYSSY